MEINKVLSLTITLYSTLYNYSNAQVSIELKENGEYFVQCNNKSRTFKDTVELSNRLNDFTGNYFRINSIELDNNRFNTIIFKGINNIYQCTLSIKGNSNIHPHIKLRFNNNANSSSITINDSMLLSIRSNHHNLQCILHNLFVLRDDGQIMQQVIEPVYIQGEIRFMRISNAQFKLHSARI